MASLCTTSSVGGVGEFFSGRPVALFFDMWECGYVGGCDAIRGSPVFSPLGPPALVRHVNPAPPGRIRTALYLRNTKRSSADPRSLDLDDWIQSGGGGEINFAEIYWHFWSELQMTRSQCDNGVTTRNRHRLQQCGNQTSNVQPGQSTVTLFCFNFATVIGCNFLVSRIRYICG